MNNEQQIRCVIVDDEPMARSLIEGYVAKTPFLELRGSFGSVVEVLTLLSSEPIDLLFLDIQMPEITGLELSKMVPKNARIIFTTAFDQYALEGFRADALDYLLKPFNYQEFLAASNKALEWFSLVRNAGRPETSVAQKEFLFVKSEYRQVKIALKDVLYFEGWRDYVKIRLDGREKPVLTLMTLKALEEELPAERFMRVHRSFIVALDRIASIERNQVVIGTERITVAEQYKARFQEFVSGNSLE